MSPRPHGGRSRAKALAVLAGTVAVLAGAVIGFRQENQSGPSEPPAGLANIWIEAGAGTCTGGRSATPIAYAASGSPDRRCGTFDLAWDAMNAGDTARVVAGTYPTQCISGNKASDTKIIGEGAISDVVVERTGEECIAVFGGGSAIGLLGTNIWIENMTLDSNLTTGIGAGLRCWDTADNSTLVDVNIHGDFATAYIECDSFEWHGGVLRENPDPQPISCIGGMWLALTIYGSNVVVDGVTFGIADRQDVPTPNVGGCGSDGIPHIETVRIEAGSNFTLMNSHFVRNSEIGSGHIFSSVAVSGLKLIGNYFGQSGDNPNILQMSGLSTNAVMAYNTFDPGAGFVLNTSNFTKVGNLGPSIIGGCSGTHIKNVWGGSGSCGTDTFVGSTDLGVDDTGHLEAGSPAIGAGETPAASDYCTDAATVNSVDFEGDVRPQGTDCDAGADEYEDPLGFANLWVDGSGTCTRSSAEVSYVSATACGSLNAAYQAASPGDTIRVRAGSYGSETIAFRSSMSAAQVEVMPAEGEAVAFTDVEWLASYVDVTGDFTFRTLNVGDWNGAVTVALNNITFDGITVDHQDATTPTRRAMIVSGTTNLTVRNFDIGNTMAGTELGEDSNLVHTWGDGPNVNLTFEDGVFHDNDSPGNSDAHNECMYLPNVAPLTIRRNEFQSCTYYGIFLTDFQDGGIETSDSLTIENNVFRAGKFDSGEATYYWAISFHPQIDETPATNAVIQYNTIENGLSLGFTGTPVSLTVRGNVIGTGVWQDDISSGQCKSGATFSYNVMPTNCGATNTTVTEAEIRADWVSVNTTWDAAENFHLVTGAAAIGAGDPSSAPAVDLDGAPRGSPADAGAYEFVP